MFRDLRRQLAEPILDSFMGDERLAVRPSLSFRMAQFPRALLKGSCDEVTEDTSKRDSDHWPVDRGEGTDKVEL